MKRIKVISISLFLFFITLSLSSFAQTAVLFNFDYRVPDEFRREIQVYDENGQKKYKEDLFSNQMILDKYTETLSKKEVNIVCESAAEIYKLIYEYSDVKVMYPASGSITSDKLSNFPNRKFKRTAKKNPADAYISMEIAIKSNGPFIQWSDLEDQSGVERVMFMNITCSLTIFNSKEEVLEQLQFSLNDDLNQLFGEKYATEIDDKGRYKLWKPYLSKQDMIGIYNLAEQKLESQL